MEYVHRKQIGEEDSVDPANKQGNGSNGDDADEMPALSAATLLALQQFALDSGVAIDPVEEEAPNSSISVLASVRRHFEVQDKEDEFHYEFESKDRQRKVNFKLKGIKKELGQTLDSTGLTM